MIDRLFLAPKQLRDLDFALSFSEEKKRPHLEQKDLGIELLPFLENSDFTTLEKFYNTYHERLKWVPGWLCLNGPAADISPMTTDSEVGLTAFHRFTQTINMAKQLGVKYVIFNMPYAPFYKVSGTYQNWLSATCDFWQFVVDEQLRGTNITVLLANVMEESPDVLIELLSRIHSPKVRLCLDVGYANVCSEIPVIDWLDRLGNDVDYVRVSNNDGRTVTYDALGEGRIDMASFINHLALLPQRFNLSIQAKDTDVLMRSFALVEPYMELQQQHMATKSLLI